MQLMSFAVGCTFCCCPSCSFVIGARASCSIDSPLNHILGHIKLELHIDLALTKLRYKWVASLRSPRTQFSHEGRAWCLLCCM